MSNVTVTIELPAEQAAGLLRFAQKIAHSDAMSVTYPHKSRQLREDQAYQIIYAFSVLERALADAGVKSWPWVETGRV